MSKSKSTPTNNKNPDPNLEDYDDISESFDERDEINDETMLVKPEEDDEEDKFDIIHSVFDEENDILGELEQEKEEIQKFNIYNEMYSISDSNENKRQRFTYKYEKGEEELFNRIVDYIDPITCWGIKGELVLTRYKLTFVPYDWIQTIKLN